MLGRLSDFSYFILYGIGISTLSVLSIVGNVLSIFVFSRSSMKSSNSTILIALSIWDLILLLSYLFSFGLPALTGNYSNVMSKFKVNLSPYIYVYFTRPLRKAGTWHLTA